MKLLVLGRLTSVSFKLPECIAGLSCPLVPCSCQGHLTMNGDASLLVSNGDAVGLQGHWLSFEQLISSHLILLVELLLLNPGN